MNKNQTIQENVLSHDKSEEKILELMDSFNMFNKNKEYFLTDLFNMIFPSTIKLDNPQYGLFKGCYDWHSCVHGFWAVFRISLENNSNVEVKEKSFKIYQILNNDDDISREVNLLKKESNFEFPYGRAWLLRLAIDYQNWCHKNILPSNRVFNLMCEEIAKDLFERLLINNIIDDSYLKTEYNNIPWVLIQLNDYYNHQGFNDRIEIIKEFVLNNYIKSIPICFSDDTENNGFFSLTGNVILCIYKTQNAENIKRFNELNPKIFNYIDPVEIGSKVHKLGLNWSRAWSLKISGFNENYWKHVKIGWIIHEKIKKEKKFENYESYYAYDHWVPQFIVYTITL